MSSLSRRSFLKTAGLATAAAAFSARSWSQVAGANSAVRHAVIGLNGRGKNHIEGFAAVDGVRLAALCDVDTAILAATSPELRLERIRDIRELLVRKDIDTISIATPNHWHSLAAIWACQAGKDVYVEKPVSHNVWEGRQLVAAAAKYDRIVQAGTQCRTNPGIIEAHAWIRAGNLGQVKVARGLCYKRRASIGKTEGPQPVPRTVDYELWLGPAPMAPVRRAKFHYDWHWFWDTGSGDLGNQGIHQMDLSRWFLGEPGLPTTAWSVGDRVGYVDDGQTPNTQAIIFDYGTSNLIFEVRGLPSEKDGKVMDQYKGASIGVIVECENGTLVIPSYTSATAYDWDGKVIKQFKGEASHFANFIAGVRSHSSQGLNGPILEGHISSALCHLGNISHRLGASSTPEVIRAKIASNKRMAETCGRMGEHLRRNGLDPDSTSLVLGEALAIDPKTEKFVDNAKADRLLTREYPRDFTVPALA
jgi:predicted dehydrogenase